MFSLGKKGYKKTHSKTKIKEKLNNYVKVSTLDESTGPNMREFSK